MRTSSFFHSRAFLLRVNRLFHNYVNKTDKQDKIREEPENRVLRYTVMFARASGIFCCFCLISYHTPGSSWYTCHFGGVKRPRPFLAFRQKSIFIAGRTSIPGRVPKILIKTQTFFCTTDVYLFI